MISKRHLRRGARGETGTKTTISQGLVSLRHPQCSPCTSSTWVWPKLMPSRSALRMAPSYPWLILRRCSQSWPERIIPPRTTPRCIRKRGIAQCILRMSPRTMKNTFWRGIILKRGPARRQLLYLPWGRRDLRPQAERPRWQRTLPVDRNLRRN